MEKTKKHFLKNMVGFSMNTWIALVIGLIASPIATRLFTQTELGRLTMFSTYAALFASIGYLGLDQAYVRFFREPPGKSTRKGMLTFCTASSLGFSVFSSLILLFFWRGISEQVMDAPDFGVFLCLCLYSFCQVQFRFLSLNYRMEQNAKLYTLQGVIQVVLTKLAYLSIAFDSALARPAILLLTALMAAFTLVFTWIQRKRFTRAFVSEINGDFVKQITLFAVPMIPIAVMSWFNSSITTVALRNLMDAAAVGVYTSGLMLASTVNVVQTGFNAYWAPYVYEHYQSDNKTRFFTVHRLMACLLTGFGLTLTLLQAPVYLLLGASFRGSAIYFPFLFLTPICYCLGETTGMGINLSKKTYWNTIIFLVTALVNLGLCFVFIPWLADAGAAMAAAGAAIVMLILRTAVGEKHFRAIPQYRYLGYTVGLMLAASLGNYLLRNSAPVKYAFLIAVYLLALYLFRREIATLWTTVKQIGKEGAGVLKRRTAQNGNKGELP